MWPSPMLHQAHQIEREECVIGVVKIKQGDEFALLVKNIRNIKVAMADSSGM